MSKAHGPQIINVLVAFCSFHWNIYKVCKMIKLLYPTDRVEVDNLLTVRIQHHL